MHPQEAAALLHFFNATAAARGLINRYWCPKVTRWAWLRLPNGQVARSHWKESLKPLGKVKMACNVKVIYFEFIQSSPANTYCY